MMPVNSGLTLTLPTSGCTERQHQPFAEVVTIADIKDEVELLPSLQKPKKVCSCLESSHTMCAQTGSMKIGPHLPPMASQPAGASQANKIATAPCEAHMGRDITQGVKALTPAMQPAAWWVQATLPCLSTAQAGIPCCVVLCCPGHTFNALASAQPPLDRCQGLS